MYDSSKMTIEERINAQGNYQNYLVRNNNKIRFKEIYDKQGKEYKSNNAFIVSKEANAIQCIHYLFDNIVHLKIGEASILKNINKNCLRWGKLSRKQSNLIKKFAYRVQHRRSN